MDVEAEIARLHFFQTYHIGFHDGWDKGGLPLIPGYPDFKPDRPQSVDYGVYPVFHVPSFHYANPVSGQKP